MNDMPQNEREFIGANNPPKDLKADLLERFAKPLATAAELLVAAGSVPAEINDDETQKSLNDLIKKMAAQYKDLEQARDVEVKPHQANVETIKATFNNPMRELDEKRKEIKKRGADYTDRKERAEQARLAKEAAEKRAIAEDAARKAEEAERTKTQASIAVGEFEKATRDATMARAEAITEVEKTAARVLTAIAAVQKVRADQSSTAADYSLRVLKGETVTDEEKAVKRTEFEQAMKKAKDELAEAQQAHSDAKTAAREAKEREDAAAAELAKSKKEVKVAGAEVEQHMGDAISAEKRADTIERRAAGPGLARTYSDHGAMSTNMRNWTSRITDVKLLPLETLRHLIAVDALDVAVRKWMNNQPATPEARQMPGTVMEIETVGVNR